MSKLTVANEEAGLLPARRQSWLPSCRQIVTGLGFGLFEVGLAVGGGKLGSVAGEALTPKAVDGLLESMAFVYTGFALGAILLPTAGCLVTYFALQCYWNREQPEPARRDVIRLNGLR